MRRVVITGAGVVSSLGDTPDALHAALCEGRSGISPVRLFDTTGLGCPLRGVNTTVSTGITSGLQAIAHAAEQIRAGRADVLLAGGAEELCFESFYGFERAGLLCRSVGHDCHHPVPFDARRNGLTLGEGAALLMLEDSQSAHARGARILAEIRGAGSGYDCS